MSYPTCSRGASFVGFSFSYIYASFIRRRVEQIFLHHPVETSASYFYYCLCCSSERPASLTRSDSGSFPRLKWNYSAFRSRQLWDESFPINTLNNIQRFISRAAFLTLRTFMRISLNKIYLLMNSFPGETRSESRVGRKESEDHNWNE